VITVSLMGGLGNQMFQYAAGKALAEHHGVGLVIDRSGFRDPKNRSFLLHKLNVPEATSDFIDVSAHQDRAINHFSRARWRLRADRMLAKAGLRALTAPANSYREPHFHFDRRFETLGPETSLFGYFQSEIYFSSIAEQLPRFFEPRDQFGGVARIAADRIDGNALPVSIHIRRGDYTQASTTSVHGLLGENYYLKAFELMEARLGSHRFDLFVFSDDLDEAKQVLRFIPPVRVNYVQSDIERPWEDMALMARCQHQIIANSSFSWWGAWLNRSPGKIVVAPRHWFAPAALRERNTCDLYPPNWILL
jgi:hypothetical protein